MSNRIVGKYEKFVFFLCLGCLGMALFLQHFFGDRPCVWCVLQRLAFSLVALAVFPSAFFNFGKWVSLTTKLASVGFALFGLYAVGMQINSLGKDHSCGLDFGAKLLEATNLEASIPFVFFATAQCDEASKVAFLGVAYYVWSGAAFTILLAALFGSLRGNSASAQRDGGLPGKANSSR